MKKDKVQPIAGMQRERLRDVIPLDTPYSVYFFPTNRCNFRCSYCAHAGGLKRFEAEYGLKPENMSCETFCRAVDQLKEFPRRIKVLNLSGQGEPLLNTSLPDMIAYAKRQDVADRIEIITNASLLNRERSEQLILAGLDCIRISLQGMNSEKYKETCGARVDFDKLTEEIRWFYEHKGQCDVFVKVMDVTLAEGEEEAFYERFGSICDRMFVEQCKPVYDTIEETKGCETATDRYGRPHEHHLVCPLPFYMLGILPDGTVSVCETIYVPERLGNVWTDTLYSMWNGEKRQAFLDMQLAKKRMGHPQCVRCCAPDDVSHPEDNLD